MCISDSSNQYENDFPRTNHIDMTTIASLDSFLQRISKKGDYIVPIARRGIRVLELSQDSIELFNNGRILVYDAVKFCIDKLKNKKIILFDEGVYSGRSLFNRKREITTLFKNYKIDIITAAFIINSDKVEIYPDEHQLEVKSEFYDYISQELDYKILSSGKPMDVDHLIGRIELEEDDIHNIKNILIDKFHATELASSYMYDSVEMFTIDLNQEETKADFDFEIVEIEGLPRIFRGGVKKLRAYLKGNFVQVIPVAYPAIEATNYSLYINKCPLSKILDEASLCNAFKDSVAENNELNNIMCYNCIINAINISLLADFLLKLSTYINFKLVGLDDKCIPLYSVFDNTGKRITQAFYEKLIKCLKENKGIVLGKIPAKELEIDTQSINYVDPKINANMSFKPFNVITEILIKNTELNKSKLKTKNEELFGLTYEQINEAYGNGRYYRDFSKGMDIALDIGSLKPVTPYDGINVVSENKSYEAIVRLYKLTGEETRDSMLCFLKLIGRI